MSYTDEAEPTIETDVAAKGSSSSTAAEVIFLSWGGQSSKSIASVLNSILPNYFPRTDIFFSPTSIEVGDDPFKKMLDEKLRKARVLIAVLTKDSASRPWVIWETASVWARQHLVVLVFVDLNPAEAPGPLAVRVQGILASERKDVDRALNRIAKELRISEGLSLTDRDWQKLRRSVKQALEHEVSRPAAVKIPANLSYQTLPQHDGLHTGTLLAIEVRARNELVDAKVLMTSIVGPTGTPTMSAPARLYWHPGAYESVTIPQAAFNLVNIAQVGLQFPGAVMKSPDSDLPWTLFNGIYRLGLQFTAKGYVAENLVASFNVRQKDSIPVQSLEWIELSQV